MAKIELRDIDHSYTRSGVEASDFALSNFNMTWEDGSACALLGPSGCGKTTLLNLISGLLRPTRGRVLFDEADVTGLDPRGRNIAQVFQFPVVYDSMTVFENLAFPLRNRGLRGETVRSRVREVAAMLELESDLEHRARGLAADRKQILSLGRGLARLDTKAILFDEPLTVVDPRVKWELRRKLRKVHAESGLTMIYVTHDQNEALTFADRTAVLNHGRVLQIGTPEELFERPAHEFVGHFIGSPGMNFINCRLDTSGGAGERFTTTAGATLPPPPDAILDRAREFAARGALRLGIRPEFFKPATSEGDAAAWKTRVLDEEDRGDYRLLRVEFGGSELMIRVADNDGAAPGESRAFVPEPGRVLYYGEERLLAAG